MSSPEVAPLLAGNVLGSVGASFVVAEWKDAAGDNLTGQQVDRIAPEDASLDPSMPTQPLQK